MIVCNGTTVAVLMSSPDPLEDFALGVALPELILESRTELRD
jgi:FdhD protein